MKKITDKWYVLLLGILLSPVFCHGETFESVPDFAVIEYQIIGNTLLTDEELDDVLRPYIGANITTADIERARGTLELFYHQKGYPAVLVNIPEQTVEAKVVVLEVVESIIRRVRVTGNKYFTMEHIKSEIPSLAPGNQLFVPQLQEELGRLNRDRNLKVAPLLLPGKETGTIDVELKVKDRLPLHGTLEINNRYSHDTSSLRFNGSIRYENLWQKKHTASLQYQTSPKKLRETQVLAGSYIFPSPWRKDDLTVLYAVLSDSESSFGEGFQVIGKGNIYGVRQIFQLPSYKNYNHNITLGLDYKDFDETLGFSDEADPVYTPITYMPLSLTYAASRPDKNGVSQFSFGINLAFRNLVTDMREFELKRYKARGNYLYATAGIERRQKLPADFGLYIKLDGQLASQALIANEQYSAGGMTSVRGYKESEESGDNAFHNTVELNFPQMASFFQKFTDVVESFTPYIFYDYAYLSLRDPLPETEAHIVLSSTGLGLRSQFSGNFALEANWGLVLSSIERTKSGDHQGQFSVKYEF